MRSFAIVALVLAAACGGKSSSTTAPVSGSTATAGDRLPWEAALTTGATFTLVVGDADRAENPDLTVKVVNVEDRAGQRVYTLGWGEQASGPSKLLVRGKQVLIGDTEPAGMQEPWEMPGGILCYAEDLSNPDGCEDVCEAALCFTAASGIVMASGLYTPGYLTYSAR